MDTTPAKKPFWKRPLGIGLIAIAVIALLGALFGTDPEPEPAAGETTPAVETASAEPTTESEPDATEEPVTPETSLVAQVQQATLTDTGMDSYLDLPTNPARYTNDLEEINADTIRVYVQAELTDEERDDVGFWFLSMSCPTVDLGTVVVRDTTGIDSNHYARNVPACK